MLCVHVNVKHMTSSSYLFLEKDISILAFTTANGVIQFVRLLHSAVRIFLDQLSHACPALVSCRKVLCGVHQASVAGQHVALLVYGEAIRISRRIEKPVILTPLGK